MAKLSIVPEGASVAGAEMALTPIEIMHRMGEQWRNGASAADRAETLRAILKNDRAPATLLRMLEGGMGEKVIGLSPNKIPQVILKAAGSAKKQAKFTQTLKMLRGIKSGPASANEVRKLFGITMRAAEQAGLPTAKIDALRRMGAEEVLRAGPTNVVRIHDIATKESWARRTWRAMAGGDPVLGGKKSLGLGPTESLSATVRSQIDELEGLAKSNLADEVGAAKGVFGKAGAAVKGGAARVGEVLSPKGLTGVEEGVLGKLAKAGAKGLSKGAKAARGLGSFGAAISVPLVGYEVYDSLVGKSKRARAAAEAFNRGSTPSTSAELMYDILDKRADLQARRAMLGREPELMQQIVQSMGSGSSSGLTSSEMSFGANRGGGPGPPNMDALLDQLLGQMRGL